MRQFFKQNTTSANESLLEKNEQQKKTGKNKLVFQIDQLLREATSELKKINQFRQQSAHPQTQKPTIGFLDTCSKIIDHTITALNSYEKTLFGTSARDPQLIYQARVDALQMCRQALDGTDSSVTVETIKTRLSDQRDQSYVLNGKKQHKPGVYDSTRSPIALFNQPVVEIMQAVVQFLKPESKPASTPGDADRASYSKP